MTLATRIAATAPVENPRAVFDYARHLIGADDTYTFRTLPDPEEDFSFDRQVNPRWQMALGQGLPALMDVEHNNGQPLPLGEDHTHDLAESDSESNDLAYQPVAYVEITFDTAYGYSAPNGASCGDLHAWLVQEMGKYFDSLNVSWTWFDESGWGWREQWRGRPEWEEQVKDHPRVSLDWGSLGDPDVGALGSMIPSYADDSREEFFGYVMNALGLSRD